MSDQKNQAGPRQIEARDWAVAQRGLEERAQRGLMDLKDSCAAALPFLVERMDAAERDVIWCEGQIKAAEFLLRKYAPGALKEFPR